MMATLSPWLGELMAWPLWSSLDLKLYDLYYLAFHVILLFIQAFYFGSFSYSIFRSYWPLTNWPIFNILNLYAIFLFRTALDFVHDVPININLMYIYIP
jgi:hypothetical protein